METEKFPVFAAMPLEDVACADDITGGGATDPAAARALDAFLADFNFGATSMEDGGATLNAPSGAAAAASIMDVDDDTPTTPRPLPASPCAGDTEQPEPAALTPPPYASEAPTQAAARLAMAKNAATKANVDSCATAPAKARMNTRRAAAKKAPLKARAATTKKTSAKARPKRTQAAKTRITTDGMADEEAPENFENDAASEAAAYAPAAAPAEADAKCEAACQLRDSFDKTNPRKRKDQRTLDPGRKAGRVYLFCPEVTYACARYPDAFPSWLLRERYFEQHGGFETCCKAVPPMYPSDATLNRAIKYARKVAAAHGWDAVFAG